MNEVSSLVAVARDFSLAAHGEQRYDGEPYQVHLEAVVAVLARFGYQDPDLHAAAWLHDTLEDTDASLDDLFSAFGPHIAAVVDAVTQGAGRNRKERNAATYPKIRQAEDAVVLKLADRIANVERSVAGDGRLLRMYRKEQAAFKEALYVPGEAEDMWAHLGSLLA